MAGNQEALFVATPLVLESVVMWCCGSQYSTSKYQVMKHDASKMSADSDFAGNVRPLRSHFLTLSTAFAKLCGRSATLHHKWILGTVEGGEGT